MATYIQYIHSQTQTPFTTSPERWEELKNAKTIHNEPLYIFVKEFEKEETPKAQARGLEPITQPKKTGCRTCGGRKK